MLNGSRLLHSFVLPGVIVLFATGATGPVPQHRDGPKDSRRAGTQSRAERGPRFTSQQLTRLERRIALATALVARLEPDARARGRAQGWRQAVLESLLQLPSDRLEGLQLVSSVDALDSQLARVSGDTASPDPAEELLYTPITPCRYIDTRNIGGQINGTRGYDLALTGSTYGGSAACSPTLLFGVSDGDFGALAMNLTIVAPSGAPGFLAVKPNATAPVTSLLNWYQAGPTVQVANQAVITTDRSGLADEFMIQSSLPVHVIVDIFGAFLPPTGGVSTTTVSDVTLELTPTAVASLDVGAGRYLVLATVQIQNLSGSQTAPVLCDLNGEWWAVTGPLQPFTSWDMSTGLLSVHGIKTFGSPGSVQLQCNNNTAMVGSAASVVFARLTAIRVSGATGQ